jgi:sialate O-acetylesterase
MIMKKMFTQTYIILFLSLIFGNSLLAQTSKKRITLNGLWRFSIGDNKEWSKENYDDKTWEIIKAPSSWEDQGFHGYNGYAWYRKKVVIPSKLKEKSLSLFLGRIDDVDEVFLNGELIGSSGSFPPDYSTAYYAWRKYSIPENIIKFDRENTIAVRVYDAELSGGILEGELGLFELLGWDINLTGLWKFNISDDPNWKEKNYDDNNWDKIYVPGNWEAQGFPGYDGFAWYRINFFVPQRLKGKELLLVAGKIDDFDETYVNGQLVGSTGPIKKIPRRMENRSEWDKLRVYSIPQNLLLFGKENSIAIRVYDGFLNGGIHYGPIAILTKENYSNYLKSNKEERTKNIWESFWEDL